MAVPNWQTMMHPTLKAFKDGRLHTNSEIRDSLEEELSLTAEDLEEMMPGGRGRKFVGRVNWVLHYLKKAQLIDHPSKGTYVITAAGTQALIDFPDEITLEDLRAMEGFSEGTSEGAQETQDEDLNDAAEEPPIEKLSAAYAQLRDALADELIAQVKRISPEEFEHLVLELLEKMEYGVPSHTGQAGDGGIDGVISQDPLELEKVYVQAKRWHDKPVPAPAVQSFIGAIDQKGAAKGVIITTSEFSEPALEAAKECSKTIRLIDGEQMAHLMIENGVGVSETDTFVIYEIDAELFS